MLDVDYCIAGSGEHGTARVGQSPEGFGPATVSVGTAEQRIRVTVQPSGAFTVELVDVGEDAGGRRLELPRPRAFRFKSKGRELRRTQLKGRLRPAHRARRIAPRSRLAR